MAAVNLPLKFHAQYKFEIIHRMLFGQLIIAVFIFLIQFINLGNAAFMYRERFSGFKLNKGPHLICPDWARTVKYFLLFHMYFPYLIFASTSANRA